MDDSDLNRYFNLGYYADQVGNFFKTDGSLSLSQYKQFWTSVYSDPVGSTSYVTALLMKLLAIENGDSSPNIVELVQKLQAGESIYTTSNDKEKQEDEATTLNKHNILMTIYFLTLFCNIDSEDPSFKAVLNKWTSLPPDRSRSAIDEVIKILATSAEATDRMISIVDQCSNIEFPQSFELERSEAKYVFYSFLDVYLRNSLSKGQAQKAKVIFDNLLLFLKHPLLSEKRMLSLLFLLKQFITRSPHTTPEIITTALNIVKAYYLWPRPYSDVARDVLQLLTIELKSPGAAFRKIISEENPELLKGTIVTGKERNIYVFVDEQSANGKRIREALRNSNVFDSDISQLQVDLLANMLATTLNADAESFGIEKLSKEDLAKFYDAAVQILNEAVLMNQEDAESYRVKEMNNLKGEITTVLESSPNADGAHFLVPRNPSLPPLNFQIISVNADNSTKSAVLLHNAKYPKRHAMEFLSSIIDQYAQYADPKNKTIIKVGVLGGDSALHNLVCAYVCLKATSPKACEGVDLQFFLLPSEPGEFAIFLSKYDGWFGRHIYYGSQAPLRTIPSVSNLIDVSKPGSVRIKPTASEADLFRAEEVQTKPQFSPLLLLRMEYENYFREAKCRIPVFVYQCECWGENTFMTIPFIQRAEMGIRAFARYFQKTNDLPDNLSVSAIQQHKSFKFSPPGFGIKYTQMNILGVAKQAPALEPRSYASIVLANIPCHGDKGVPPNPTKQWIEMSAVEWDSKKKKKSKDEEGPTNCYHVSQVDIECDDKKKMFPVLLDGVLYGPFSRIRIIPCNASTEEHFAIPFMTFYPLDLPS